MLMLCHTKYVSCNLVHFDPKKYTYFEANIYNFHLGMLIKFFSVDAILYRNSNFCFAHGNMKKTSIWVFIILGIYNFVFA